MIMRMPNVMLFRKTLNVPSSRINFDSGGEEEEDIFYYSEKKKQEIKKWRPFNHNHNHNHNNHNNHFGIVSVTYFIQQIPTLWPID